MDPVEEIKAKLDIVEVIGEFVALRQQGKNLVGLCPFHQEKTPSFSVNREAQFFHCFGCKAGGDVITFWMKYHNLGFNEAVEDLCSKYGIELPKSKEVLPQSIKALYAVNEAAMDFYKRALADKEIGRSARAYLEKRGLNKEILEEFGIGYAPDSWDALSTYFQRKGLLQEGLRAGLIGKSRQGTYYDRFRDRIVFPLWGMKGEILGFGGRLLEANNNEPKYLNTPETQVFQKRRYLYGLYQNLVEIKKTREVFFVEGYVDLLTLKSYGIHNAVATLGTALTPDHLKLIKPHISEITLIFDGDTAGRKASLRVLPMFVNEEMNPKVVLLPEGHDPDSFLRERGYLEFSKLLGKATDLIEFYMYAASNEARQREDLVLAIRELLKTIKKISSPLLQGECLRKISLNMDMSYDLLLSEMERIDDVECRQVVEGTINVQGMRIKDMEALNLFYYSPYLLKEVSVTELRHLQVSESTLSLLEKMKEQVDAFGKIETDALLQACGEEEACKIREVLLAPPIFVAGNVKRTFQMLKDQLKCNLISAKVEEAKAKGDINLIGTLLKQKADLIKNLSQNI